MAIAARATWWRTAKLGPATEVLRGVILADDTWVFVGYDTGAPKIYTIPSANFSDIPPSFTTRTPNGSDPLFAVAYILAEDVVCAVGDAGRVEISFNKGASWSSFALGGNPNMRDVVGVSGSSTANMVAVGDDRISGRDSGGVWTTRWTGSQDYYSVAYRSGVGWVAVGANGYATHSATAAAGTFLAPYILDSLNLWSVAGNDSIYIAGGSAGKIFRSSTGLSASWNRVQLDVSEAIVGLMTLGPDDDWAVVTAGGQIFVSGDNGASWTKSAYVIADTVWDINKGANMAAAVGANGGIYYSDNSVQEDYIPIAAPQVPPALSDNDDMAGDAVARLATQFRS